jgi:hypothetical protein
MNLNVIIPEKWNPECKKSFNKWINRVHTEVKKKKIKKS